jgi:hypothetical protein
MFGVLGFDFHTSIPVINGTILEEILNSLQAEQYPSLALIKTPSF